MNLRWTNEAVVDLERIGDYLFEKTPENAARLLRAIHEAPAKLISFPFLGRPGRKDGTRELVLTPLPYLVVYRVASDSIQILRLLHGAQKWP